MGRGYHILANVALYNGDNGKKGMSCVNGMDVVVVLREMNLLKAITFNIDHIWMKFITRKLLPSRR